MSETKYELAHLHDDMAEVKRMLVEVHKVVYVGNGRPSLRESQAEHDRRIKALEDSQTDTKRFWLGIAGSVLASGVVGVVSALATVAMAK